MKVKVDLDFYNQLRVAIHKEWDHIGVYSYSEEMGEYDGYLPKLYELLKEGARKKKFSIIYERLKLKR